MRYDNADLKRYQRALPQSERSRGL
jgi:hypothetical protein